MLQKYRLGTLRLCSLFGATLAMVGCGFINPSVAPKTRFGLWNAEIVSDNCGVGDAVKSYFSSGEVNNIPDPNETVRERVLGQMAHNGDEEGFYKLRYRNQYEHLLGYLIEQSGVDPLEGCTSEINIEMSRGHPEQDFENYVRVGSEQEYSIESVSENTLCLIKILDGSNWSHPFVTTRSCTNLVTKENTFSVQFE